MPSRAPGVTRRLGIAALIAAALLGAWVAGRALLAEDGGLPAAEPASTVASTQAAPTSRPAPAPPRAPEPKPAPVTARVAAPTLPEGQHGAAVWGLVIDPRGSPVGNATLWIHPRRDELALREGTEPPPVTDPQDTFQEMWSTLGVRVDADLRGNYDSGLLDAGTWLVCVSPPGDKWAASAKVVTLADREIRELNLPVSAPLLLRGYVQTESGNPARGASVQVLEVGLAPSLRRSLDLVSDNDAFFSAHVSPDVELLVRAEGATGNASASVHLPRGTAEVTVALKRDDGD